MENSKQEVNQVINLSAVEQNLKKSKFPFWLVILLPLLIILFIGVFYSRNIFEKDDTYIESKILEENDIDKVCLEREDRYSKNLFEGELTLLKEDLDLFQDHVSCVINNSCEYYTAGIFKSGYLQGYTRIVALTRDPGFLSPPYVDIILATKDFENYILHVPDCDYKRFEMAREKGYEAYIKDEKIIAQRTFETEHPQYIDLDEIFSLVFYGTFYSGMIDFLHSFDNIEVNYLDAQSTDLKISEVMPGKPSLIKHYELEDSGNVIKTRTYTLIEDSTGLRKWYSLNFRDSQKAYEEALEGWDKTNEIEFRIPRPYYRGLGFNSVQINRADDNIKFYDNYWNYLESGKGYGGERHALIVNIEIEELDQVGYIYNKVPLYRLKKTDSLLYKLAYDINIGSVGDEMEDLFYKRHLREVPTFEEYVQNNPLLFFQDYWGRWTLISESQFNTNFQ